MFKTPWFNRALIESDEGYSVRWGQDWAIYCEGHRELTLTIDVGGSGASIFVGSVTRWDDDSSTTIPADTQMRIVENVRRALEWKRFRVDLVP
jgi:hypothetical protein